MRRTLRPDPVTREQLALLDRLAGGNPDRRAFLAYVYGRQTSPDLKAYKSRSIWALDEAGAKSYVEIPYQSIQKGFPNADWKPLSEAYSEPSASARSGFGAQTPPDVPAAVIQTRGHWAEGNRCRRYRLDPTLARRLRKLEPKTAAEASRTEWVNPFNGRVVRAALRSIKTDGSRHPHPPLVVAALDVLDTGVLDVERIEEYVGRIRRSASVGSPGGDRRRRNAGLLEAHAVATAAWRSYSRGVLRQRPTVDWPFATYPLAYKVATSGRIYQRGGGAQNFPGELKRAAYERVPGVADFDIRRSHLAGAVLLMGGAGLLTEALAELYGGDDDLTAVELQCGLRAGALKSVLYPLMSGGRLPEPTDAAVTTVLKGRTPRDAAVRVVRDEAEVGTDGREVVPFRDRYERAYDLLGPALWEIKEWHEHLAYDYVPAVCTSGRGGQFVENACGMKLLVRRAGGGPLTPTQAAKTVAPHLLQGLEAAYVHALTVLLAGRGVRVVSNEHDGLIALGEPSAEDLAVARHESGFHNAELVRKW